MKSLLIATLLGFISFSSFASGLSLVCYWDRDHNEAASIDLKSNDGKMLLSQKVLQNKVIEVSGILPSEIYSTSEFLTAANTGNPSLEFFTFVDSKRVLYLFNDMVLDKNSKITLGFYSLNKGVYEALVKNVEFKIHVPKSLKYDYRDYISVPNRKMVNVANLEASFKDLGIKAFGTCDLGYFNE